MIPVIIAKTRTIPKMDEKYSIFAGASARLIPQMMSSLARKRTRTYRMAVISVMAARNLDLQMVDTMGPISGAGVVEVVILMTSDESWESEVA